MEDIFFYKKGKKILLCLYRRNNRYVSEIASSIESTYAHTFNLLKGMEGIGIVTSAKEGRTKYIKLTPKGKKLAKIALDFETTLKTEGKGTEPPRTTPTLEKLERYKASLGSMAAEVKSRKLKHKEFAKYSRIIGRYKSLMAKVRPKDKAGKSIKSDVLSLVSEIESVLKKYK